MKKALKRMAAAALVTLSVLRGGDAFAQNAVDGRVVDANGAPLVGVTVLIKGTQSGTATGANGSYSIKAREDQTLVFSYLGYTTVEEYVGKRTAINVKMTEEASQIGAVEIVNIGYGTTTRRDLTGSVAKADLGTMMKANVTNFDQALGGRIAGVVVTTGDGSLGAEANITGRRNTVAQVHAGNDLMMPGEPSQSEEIIRAVREGRLDEKEVDICVERMLKYIMRTPRFRRYTPSNRPDFTKNATIARQAAAEGIVLLSNRQKTLPLPPESRIALFGVHGYDYIGCGTGAGYVYAPYMTELNRSFTEAGFRLDSIVDNLYAQYRSFGEILYAEQNRKLVLGNRIYTPENSLTPEFIEARAATNDIAVISFGRLSGEGNDRPTLDFYLSDDERTLLERVCTIFHAAGRKVVVILNIGGVIETDSWHALPDAILVGWQGGQEGGCATVDVLSGKVSPSGRLPMTFPKDYTDHPSSQNYPLNYRSYRGDWADNTPERKFRNLGYTDYEEDIWVGYRYFNTWASDRIVFPFGFGLSYTTFEWSNAALKLSRDECLVTLQVTNSGTYPTKEVIELFVAAPGSTLPKPVRELKAFAKTRMLEPGESTMIRLCFRVNDLASFDPASASFVTDAGTYTIELASSANEIRLKLPLKIPATRRRVHNVLNPQQPICVPDFQRENVGSFRPVGGF